MIRWFLNWRQQRRTDRLLALIQCRSGYHPDVRGGDFSTMGYCRWCGHDVLGDVLQKRFEEC